jgi:hypothetical protein
MLRPAQTTVMTMDSQAPTNSDGEQTLFLHFFYRSRSTCFFSDAWMNGSWFVDECLPMW